MACKNVKSITEYGIGAVNMWLEAGKRPNLNWRCFECQHPSGKACQEDGQTNIPEHPIPHNPLIIGHYYCDDCRYPLCPNCGINGRP